MPEDSTIQVEGRIVKGVGGFYYVRSADTTYECRARGRFRKDGITPLVGDLVSCTIDKVSNTGMISEILPRKNFLIRPPVANITQIAIVFSVANPKPNLRTIDKLISSAMYAGISPVICINKTDLESGGELFDIYSSSGFDTICVSALENSNIDLLMERLAGEITVFAGDSGVGKSSLLNRVLKDVDLEVGAVSNRVERGRHTTRHSELMPLENNEGYIIDTPGFSSFSVSDFDIEKLPGLFPEFAQYTDRCKFQDCSHTVEDGCAVLQALENGKIQKSRHDSYLEQYNEIKSKKIY